MVGMPSFEGKVAVVTGGASGIGRAIAEELVSGGARVVIADVDGEAVKRSAQEIGAVGVPVDVSDTASMEAFAEQVRARTLEEATGAEIVRISPAEVARVALAAIRDGSFYALPQPVMAPRLRRRLDAIEAAFTSGST